MRKWMAVQLGLQVLSLQPQQRMADNQHGRALRHHLKVCLTGFYGILVSSLKICYEFIQDGSMFLFFLFAVALC